MVATDTLTARLHPRMALAALVAAIRSCGGTVSADAPPRGPVIWATGAAGLRALSQDLGRPVGRGEKGQALALRHTAPDTPQIYAPGLHIVPHADGSVAIGSTSERDYADATTTDAQLDALHARALAVWPVLAGAPVIGRWAGERPRAASRTLVLGPWPGRAGHFIANGGFKTGFAMAPLAAALMVDLVLDGHDALPDAWRLG
jgi:glycine/D-amino acid oxidase-like deaminating enzyme